MLEVEKPADLNDHIGAKMGTSDWVTVSQEMINKFADATGDHQWIHVDIERAKREMPNGSTIAHGFLTLSLLPLLMDGCYRIKQRSRGINYGSNKVRFTAPVPSGSRVRLHLSLKGTEPIEGGIRIFCNAEVEIENQTRPALVAETIMLAYD